MKLNETEEVRITEEHKKVFDSVFGENPPKLTFYKEPDGCVCATNGMATVRFVNDVGWCNIKGIKKARLDGGVSE